MTQEKCIQDYIGDPRLPSYLREWLINSGSIRNEIKRRLEKNKAAENPDKNWIKEAEDYLSKPTELEQWIMDTLDKADRDQQVWPT